MKIMVHTVGPLLQYAAGAEVNHQRLYTAFTLVFQLGESFEESGISVARMATAGGKTALLLTNLWL